MKNPLLCRVCDECGRGMIPDIRRQVGRCYVCLRECSLGGVFWDFDPTGEDVRIHPNEVVHAMLAESLNLHSQAALADRMNVTAGFVSDVIHGKRAVSDVISKYYWLERTCWFMPRFSQPSKTED